jgi:hypothetical protein
VTTLSRRAALLSLSAFTVVAEMNSDDSLVETKGILNGRAWNSLSKETKIAVLRFIQDAAVFFNHKEKGPFGDKDSGEEYFSSSAQKITLSDVAAEIDRLYSRPYNLVVPIIAIMPIAIAIFQGATEEGVESSGGALTILRNVWSK